MCGCFILSFPTNHWMKAPSGVLAWSFHQRILYGLYRIPGGSLSAKRPRQFGERHNEKQKVEPPACTVCRDVVLFAFLPYRFTFTERELWVRKPFTPCLLPARNEGPDAPPNRDPARSAGDTVIGGGPPSAS